MPTTRNAAPAPPYTRGEVPDPVRGSSAGTVGALGDAEGVTAVGTGVGFAADAPEGAGGRVGFCVRVGGALGAGVMSVGGATVGDADGVAGTDGLGTGAGVLVA
ncbi:hypothetical protein [Streptodolium elevatio]